MESDDDDDDEVLDNHLYRPFDYVLAEDDDPSQMTEHFNLYFQTNYHTCPVFYVGTFLQAVDAAFHSESVEDCRPLLIYLHGETSLFTPLICSEILAKNKLIEYLLENYIVWPWDVTSEANRLKFAEWWYTIFPDSHFAYLRIEDCPLLIGVMRASSTQQARYSPFDYQFRILLRGDLLVSTNQRSTLENVLETLGAFRQEWQRNEKLWSFDFSGSTGLCLDVLLEIAKYLSLNDTINTFSMSILPVLREATSKVHLVNPSRRFLEMIPRHLDPEQITSVRLTNALTQSDPEILSASFNQLISLTLLNPPSLYTFDQCLLRFPTVSALSLWFEEEFYFPSVVDRWNSPFTRVARLQIRCAGARCDHFQIQYGGNRYAIDTNVTSFIFDSGHYPLRPCTYCPRNDPACFLSSAVEFIRSLVNIRRVRFITNRRQSEIFLQVNLLQELIRKCVHLERVILQLVDHGELTQEANNIEQELRQIRPGLIFRIKTA